MFLFMQVDIIYYNNFNYAHNKNFRAFYNYFTLCSKLIKFYHLNACVVWIFLPINSTLLILPTKQFSKYLKNILQTIFLIVRLNLIRFTSLVKLLQKILKDFFIDFWQE